MEELVHLIASAGRVTHKHCIWWDGSVCSAVFRVIERDARNAGLCCNAGCRMDATLPNTRPHTQEEEWLLIAKCLEMGASVANGNKL